MIMEIGEGIDPVSSEFSHGLASDYKIIRPF